MTAKHRDPEYLRNARLIRSQVKAAWRHGERVQCWRGRGAILPGQPFDVGHLDPHGGNGRGNLAAEHRSKVDGCCKGNRSHGGTIGANLTNQRHTRQEATTWRL